MLSVASAVVSAVTFGSVGGVLGGPKSESLLYLDAHWMDDAETDHCLNARCGAKFSLLRKKHHCRHCGKIFCEKCAPRQPIPDGTPWLRVNVTQARQCNSCRLPRCFRATRPNGSNSPLDSKPAEIIMSFLDAKSIGRLHVACAVMLHQFPVPGVPYFESLQERFKTLYSGAQVGKGACGTVYKVEDWNGSKVAVKVVEKSHVYSYYTWRKLFAEIDIMRGNQHVNVAGLLEVFQTPTQLAMVMELGEGGSLKRAFEVVRKKQYNMEVFTANVVGQVAAGLDYLYHQRHIVHRDIKHDNIVLSKDFSRVMIIDFGLAEYVRDEVRQNYVPCGTMGFASPENIKAVVERKTRFQATGYEMHESDLFSLGVAAFMMLSGEKPFKGTRFSEQYQEVKRGLKCNSPRWLPVSTQAKSLIEWLLKGPTFQRARACDAVNHPWVVESIHKFSVIEHDRLCELEMIDRLESDQWVFVANQMRLTEEWRVIDDETIADAEAEAAATGKDSDDAARTPLQVTTPVSVEVPPSSEA